MTPSSNVDIRGREVFPPVDTEGSLQISKLL